MQLLCVLSELKDLDSHNFINLDEESEEENFRVIVIYFLLLENQPIDSEQWKKQIMDLS
jgi:hypothetical protein